MVFFFNELGSGQVVYNCVGVCCLVLYDFYVFVLDVVCLKSGMIIFIVFCCDIFIGDIEMMLFICNFGLRNGLILIG